MTSAQSAGITPLRAVAATAAGSERQTDVLVAADVEDGGWRSVGGSAMTHPDHHGPIRTSHDKATLPRWVLACSWATARAGRRPAWRRSSRVSGRAAWTRARSTCRAARPRTPCRRSTPWSRPHPMSRSAATRSAAGSRASPPPSPMRRTSRSCCFSYPLHPPGGPERTDARIAHWPAIRCPVLLLSGESDPFARIDLLRASVGTLAQRGTGHVPASRAHPQAGPRRRPGPRRGVPRERAGTRRP